MKKLLLCVTSILLLASIALAADDAVGQMAVPDVDAGGRDDSAQLIYVQPNVRYNACGKSDMERLRSYFRGASWEWGIRKDEMEKLKVLGVNRFRGINIEGNNLTPDSKMNTK